MQTKKEKRIPKLKDRRNNLTKYALKCGYVQDNTKNFVYTKLYFERKKYWVKQFDTNGLVFKEFFLDFKSAQKRYFSAIK